VKGHAPLLALVGVMYGLLMPTPVPAQDILDCGDFASQADA
jgi:hypothetical protein